MDKGNCAYHPDRPVETFCAGCGRGLCTEHPEAKGERGRICPVCLAREAAGQALAEEGDRREEQFALQSETGTKGRRKTALFIVVTLLCGLFILYRAWTTGGFSSPEPAPYRLGASHTDAATDQCIRNLWEMSRALQAGEDPTEEWVCPACGLPYILTEVDGQTTVRCPCPEAHHLTRLGFSRTAPIPEAVP